MVLVNFSDSSTEYLYFDIPPSTISLSAAMTMLFHTDIFADGAAGEISWIAWLVDLSIFAARFSIVA